MEEFLPLSKKELHNAGIDRPDFVYVSGDAYVDHPSFGTAIICRLLWSRGYSVGLICQPDWNDPDSIREYGEPRYAFLVSSGNMDSMVNHYTVSKKRRSHDAYSPGGGTGYRPDRAVIVYCSLIRRAYKRTPLIIGGIEASLRRLGHYDYWSDRVRRSILLESGADLISYGMGEHSIIEIADALSAGIDIRDLTFIDGTVYKTRNAENIYDAIRLPDYGEIRSDKRAYAKSVAIQYANTDPYSGKRLFEVYDGSLYVVQNPPAKPLTEQEMDDVYALPYQRAAHPSYEEKGGIPALTEIRYSLTSNRGCCGGCSFCALTFHEGRIVQTRSHASILKEAEGFLREKEFKGYIHDVGGPTAQFRHPACEKQTKQALGACPKKQCLYPKPCRNLIVDHSDYLALLRKLRALPGVKKVFIRSGIRFDYLMADPDRQFFYELCRHHISGQLRVAPEHISDSVLAKMGKPKAEVYDAFLREFEAINQRIGKEQYAVPYLMSSHPGSTLKDAIALAEYLNRNRISPEQVQDFYPTPGTLSTCMYYTGIDPRDMTPVYVARSPHEKAMQRALIQFRRPENYELVREALLREHREDLIGFGENCLIPPRKMKEKNGHGSEGGRRTGQKRNEEGRNSRKKLAQEKGNSRKKQAQEKGNSRTRYEPESGNSRKKQAAENGNRRTKQRHAAENGNRQRKRGR